MNFFYSSCCKKGVFFLKTFNSFWNEPCSNKNFATSRKKIVNCTKNIFGSFVKFFDRINRMFKWQFKFYRKIPVLSSFITQGEEIINLNHVIFSMDINQNDERSKSYNQPQNFVWNSENKNNWDDNHGWNKIYSGYPCKNTVASPKITNIFIIFIHYVIHITAFVIGLLAAFHAWNRPYLILCDEELTYYIWYTSFYFSYWMYELANIESLYSKTSENIVMGTIILNLLLSIVVFTGLAITGKWLLLVSIFLLFAFTAFAILQFTGLKIF